jgi:hypothetical protein
MNTIVEGEEGDGNEESLIHELNSFLDDDTTDTSANLDAFINAMPEVPSAVGITASTTSIRSTSIRNVSVAAASQQDGGALAE